MGHQHITLCHRKIIARLLRQNYSIRGIAKILGYSASAICKEIKRNRNYRGDYLPESAHWKAKQRKRRRNKPRKQNDFLVGYVQNKLNLYWSPEQISGRLCRENPTDKEKRISFKTIYRWLHQGSYSKRSTVFTGYARKLRLKRMGKSWGEKRSPTLPLPGIELRGETSGFGHWECDLVHGRNRSGYILTLVDRSSGYLLASPCRKKEMAEVNAGMCRLLGDLPPGLRLTATCDRGKEFYGFGELEATLGIRSYFCNPGSPHEKGLNEQTNGLLRQFFPRRMDFSTLDAAKVNWAVALINHRPRKKFGYKTTVEILRERGLEKVLTFI